MPRGSDLSDATWERRHRAIVCLSWVMIAATIPYGLHVHMPTRDSLSVVVAPLLLMLWVRRVHSREWRSVLVTLSLFIGASTYVYLAGGATEAHFMYFVLVGVISLYQDWRPFLVGLGLVLVNHAVLGLLMPRAVFGSHDSMMSTVMTFKLAVGHGLFLLASTVASIVAWKASEVQARTDELTGLPNRRVLVDELERLIEMGNEPGVGVLFLDLCGFKKVNDVYGHDAGDRLLVEVAVRLRTAARSDDVVGRIGGDEFVIVMPHTDRIGALAMATRVALACAEPIAVDDRSVRVTASVGVHVVVPSDGVTAFEVLRDADLAMYAAKHEFADAGGHTAFCQQMRDEARADFEIELDLASCVENNELRLVYQPIVDMVTSKVVGAEALLRWQHPSRGLLSPLTFIPIAERTGEIVAIGRWVMQQALAQVSAWDNDVPGNDLTLNVNVSTHQLKNLSIIDDVRRALDTSMVAPSRLALEVTESAMLGGDHDVAVLRGLKELGVRLALDDFGTGYSSLSYLGRLPIDDLKIDKSFTDDIPVGPNRPLMAGVLAMAGQIGLSVVVEGVERIEQVRDLLSMGARLGQGYLFSKPLTPERFLPLIAGANDRNVGHRDGRLADQH